MERTDVENVNVEVYDTPLSQQYRKPSETAEDQDQPKKRIDLKGCLIVAILILVCCLIGLAGFLVGKSEEEQTTTIIENNDDAFPEYTVDEIHRNLLILEEKIHSTNFSTHEVKDQVFNMSDHADILKLMQGSLIGMYNLLNEQGKNLTDLRDENVGLTQLLNEKSEENEEIREEIREINEVFSAEIAELNSRIEAPINSIGEITESIEVQGEDIDKLRDEMEEIRDEFSEEVVELERKIQAMNDSLDKRLNATKTCVLEGGEEVLQLDEGWIVIQRREIFDVSFYQTYLAYEQGFRGVTDSGDLWLGLKLVSELTNNGSTWKMRTDFKSWEDDQSYWIEYTGFSVGDTSTKYLLTVGTQTGGTFTDYTSGWKWHEGFMFSAYDVQNDPGASENGAVRWKGGWWYNGGHFSANLNSLRAWSATDDWTHMTYFIHDITNHQLQSSKIRIKAM